MDYLSYSDWKEMGLSDITEEEFKRFMFFATSIFHTETRNYYMYHDFVTDDPVRKDKVKRALALLILYMETTGILTASQSTDRENLTGISIGRTTISKARGNDSSSLSGRASFPPKEFFSELNGTGLLFRGIHYDR